jgi:hypothetical protein
MPPSLSIVEIYESRLGARRATVSALERRSFRFSLVRVAIAASAGVILFAGGLAAAWWVLAPVVLFLAAMVRHAKLLNRIDRARSAAAFYERGLARIRGAWAGQGRPGDRLQPPDHVFAEALDLFGRGTLFDLLSTVRTDAGEETLAGWLLAPASPDRARIRQAAVKELSGLLDLREAMAVAGDVVRQGVSAARVRSWATTPIHLRGTLLRIVIGLVVATSAALMGWYFFTGALGPMWLAVLALQGLIAMRFRSAVHDVTHAIDEPARELEVLAELLRVLERERFENATLVTLQQQIGGERRPASGARPRQ